MEDRGLRNRISGMIVFFILALLTLISFGLAQETSSTFGNQTANEMNEVAIASDLFNNATAAIEEQSIGLGERSGSLEVLAGRNRYYHGLKPI